MLMLKNLNLLAYKFFVYLLMLIILHYASNWQALEGSWQLYPPTFTNGNSSSIQQRLCQQPFIFTTRRQYISLKFLSMDKPYCFVLNPLGIKLDRALMFLQHLQSLHKKLTLGSSWDADATILCTATLALVHFMAEYHVPVWCHSTHIDKLINNALCIVTVCLCPSTHIDNLFIRYPTKCLCPKTCTVSSSSRSGSIIQHKGSFLHLVDSCSNLNQGTHLCLLYWIC